jgi:hypothetical protein
MAALLALVALAAAPTFVAGAELYAPNLKFNWTLRPFDGPLEFTGWEPAGNLAGGWVRASGYIGGSAGVEFIGTGLSFNGRGSNWGRTDSNGLPDPAGYAYVTGDPTWANTDTDRGLLQPASDSVLWQRSTPRFQEYKMSIQAFYGNWTFESATVTTGMNASDEVTSLDEVPRTIVNFVGSDGQVNTTFFSTTGRWEVTPASDQLPEHVTCYDDAVVRVHIPPGTGFMVINGTRSTASRTLYLKIAPIDDELDQQTYTIDATFGYTTEAVLFILPIDTNTPQLLIMDCVLSGQGQQGLTTITFYG